MRTFHHDYTDETSLKQFIDNANTDNTKSILLICRSSFWAKETTQILDTIKLLLPSASFIGLYEPSDKSEIFTLTLILFDKLSITLQLLPIDTLYDKAKSLIQNNTVATILFDNHNHNRLDSFMEQIYALSPDYVATYGSFEALSYETPSQGVIFEQHIYDDGIIALSLNGDACETLKACHYFQKKFYAISRHINTLLNDNIQLQNMRYEEAKMIFISQSRLAIIGEMLSMIAHQWRQPLALISMIVNKLLISTYAKPDKDDTVIYDLGVIEKKIKYLTHTIDDFKNYFSPKNEKSHISPTEICDSIEALILSSIKNSHIQLRTKIFHNEPLFIYGNELIQVLLAIINNAIDVLKSKNTTDKEIIIIGEMSSDKKHYSFSVKDNGGGIDETVIDKIFEPYTTTKGVSGTGLGLFMAKTIISQHFSGHIYVKNVNNGANFTVTFPIITTPV